jgi:hypothetical protein
MLPLSIVRVALLAFGILALLGATVLFGFLVRQPIRAWMRLSDRVTGAPVRLPRALGVLLHNEPLLRAWQGLWGLVFLGLWWYLGTPGGVARWAALASQAPR